MVKKLLVGGLAVAVVLVAGGVVVNTAAARVVSGHADASGTLTTAGATRCQRRLPLRVPT